MKNITMNSVIRYGVYWLLSMLFGFLLLVIISLVITISKDNTSGWYKLMATERRLLAQQIEQQHWNGVKNREQNGLAALAGLQKSDALNSLKKIGFINSVTIKIIPLALQLGLIRISRLALSLPLWVLLIALAIIEGQRRRIERRLLGERESVTRYRYARHISHGILFISIIMIVVLPMPLSIAPSFPVGIIFLIHLPFSLFVGLSAGAFALSVRYRIACYKKYT